MNPDSKSLTYPVTLFDGENVISAIKVFSLLLNTINRGNFVLHSLWSA